MRKHRLVLFAVLTGWLPVGMAQVVHDGTVGPAGMVSGPNFTIPAAAGATRGNNLFHSFSQFNLSQGDTATFTGPATIKNIITRVTGGRTSTIDGTIDTTGIPGANFFFINPFGVTFGQHAKVNVSGSFVATTADYVKLADGGRFDARNPANDVLTSAPVSAFGFLGPTVAPITLTGTLGDQYGVESIHVDPGATVALIGGDIKISTTTITATDGRIAVVSVGSAGELAFDSADPAAPVDTSRFTTLGSIQIANSTYLDGSGNHGGRVVLDGQIIRLSDHCVIDAQAFGDGTGLGVSLRARDSVELTGQTTIAADNNGVGTGGNIDLTARSITLDNSFLETTVQGGGVGGNIDITGATIQLLNSSVLGAQTLFSTRGGNISIQAGNLVLDQSSVTTETLGGQAGTISITAKAVVLDHGGGISAATSFGSDNGGLIQLDCQSLTLRNGGQISVESDSAGAAGDITIHAATITITGSNLDPFTGISGRTLSPDAGGGSGGKIQITTESLVMQHTGALIATSTDGDGGAAGDLTIHAATVVVDHGASIQSVSQNTSAAGAITLTAADSVLIQDGGKISVAAPQANGGDITLTGGRSIQVHDSQISAQAQGNGGNIHLTAPGTIYLLHSQVNAQAGHDGGNVTVDPQFIVLNGSVINTSAVHDGGNLTLEAKFIFIAPKHATSLLYSGQSGVDGILTISSPNTDLTGDFTPLDAPLLDAEALLKPHCSVRLPRGVSSFTRAGRGGWPIEPNALLPAYPGTK